MKKTRKQRMPGRREVKHAYFNDAVKLPGRNLDQYTKGESRQTLTMFYIPDWDKLLVVGTHQVNGKPVAYERLFPSSAAVFFDLC